MLLPLFAYKRPVPKPDNWTGIRDKCTNLNEKKSTTLNFIALSLSITRSAAAKVQSVRVFARVFGSIIISCRLFRFVCAVFSCVLRPFLIRSLIMPRATCFCWPYSIMEREGLQRNRIHETLSSSLSHARLLYLFFSYARSVTFILGIKVPNLLVTTSY